MFNLKTVLAYKWKSFPKGVEYITQHPSGYLIAHMVSGKESHYTQKVFEYEEGFTLGKTEFQHLKEDMCMGRLPTISLAMSQALETLVAKLEADNPINCGNAKFLLYQIALRDYIIDSVLLDSTGTTESQKRYARKRATTKRNKDRYQCLPNVDDVVYGPDVIDPAGHLGDAVIARPGRELKPATPKLVDAPVPTGSPLVYLVAKNVPMWPVSATGDDGYVWQDEQGVLMVSYSAVESEPVQYAYQRMLSMPGEPRALELACNRVVNDAVVYIDKASWLAEHDRMAQDLEAVRKEAGAMKIDK